MSQITWIGIFICLTQSAMLSGLNLGLFTLSRLELQVEAKKGDNRAKKVLHFREKSNFSLATILWGNVAVNVILALISGSAMTGISAFLFSTVIITIFAEILPQSYFSRHALKLTALLSPVLKFYQFVLYPVARPTAWVLDNWLGGEEISYFRERDLRQVIKLHMEAAESDIARVEGQGALNFLEIDDVPLFDEGEDIDPESIISLEFKNGLPVFPEIKPSTENEFLQKMNRSGMSLVLITDQKGEPGFIIKSDDFIRGALFNPEEFNPYRYCHRPLIVRDSSIKLGELINQFQTGPGAVDDDIIENDVILLWNHKPRIVTGTDILGRLLRGIARQPSYQAA
jgi:metal transporter CNNM